MASSASDVAVEARLVPSSASSPLVTGAGYYYLCLNCGSITPYVWWEALQWNPEGEGYVPHPKGQEDPLMRCPTCRWVHTDSDDNPGVYDGSRAEVEKYRAEVEPDYRDDWADPAR